MSVISNCLNSSHTQLLSRTVHLKLCVASSFTVHSMIHQLNSTIIMALLIIECYNVKHLEGKEVFSLCVQMLCSCSTA